MRSTRRTVTLSLISALLIYLTLVRVQPTELAIVGNSVNSSWFADFPVIHEPSLSQEDRSVLIIVTSAPGNVNKRNAIRETWGSWPHVKVLYLIGSPSSNREQLQARVEDEVSANGDVVQLDFIDTYRNLTLKSCALIKWAMKNSWPNRELVIKVDDDTCVDMPLLTSVLSRFTDGVYGEIRNEMKPLRCKQSACSKWGLTIQEYGNSTFPPHVQGAFYVIAGSALRKLHANLFVPRFLFIEDVYLTGLVARAANVTLQPMPMGAKVNPMMPGKAWRQRKNVLAQHRCNQKLQHEFWAHTIRKTMQHH